MAINLGWSSQPDERVGFGGGSKNSPFEAKWFWIGVGFMMNVFFEKKRYKIQGRNRFEENTETIPRQWHQKCLLVFLNANRNNLQAHEITVVAFHPKVFRVSYFS